MKLRSRQNLTAALGTLANAGVVVMLYVSQTARGGEPILRPSLAGVRQPLVLSGWAMTMAHMFFLALALIELPMMVFAIRRLALQRQSGDVLLLLSVALFCFFPVIYAILCLILTNHLGWSTAIAATGLLRLIASVIWIPVK